MTVTNFLCRLFSDVGELSQFYTVTRSIPFFGQMQEEGGAGAPDNLIMEPGLKPNALKVYRGGGGNPSFYLGYKEVFLGLREWPEAKARHEHLET